MTSLPSQQKEKLITLLGAVATGYRVQYALDEIEDIINAATQAERAKNASYRQSFEDGYAQGVKDGKDGMDDACEEAYKSGQHAARERVRGLVEATKIPRKDLHSMIYNRAVDALFATLAALDSESSGTGDDGRQALWEATSRLQ